MALSAIAFQMVTKYMETEKEATPHFEDDGTISYTFDAYVDATLEVCGVLDISEDEDMTLSLAWYPEGDGEPALEKVLHLSNYKSLIHVLSLLQETAHKAELLTK